MIEVESAEDVGELACGIGRGERIGCIIAPDEGARDRLELAVCLGVVPDGYDSIAVVEGIPDSRSDDGMDILYDFSGDREGNALFRASDFASSPDGDRPWLKESIRYVGDMSRVDDSVLSAILEIRVREAESGVVESAFRCQNILRHCDEIARFIGCTPHAVQSVSLGLLECPIPDERISALMAADDVSCVPYAVEENGMGFRGVVETKSRLAHSIDLPGKVQRYIDTLEDLADMVKDVYSVWSHALRNIMSTPFFSSGRYRMCLSCKESTEWDADDMAALAALCGADRMIEALICRGLSVEDITRGTM